MRGWLTFLGLLAATASGVQAQKPTAKVDVVAVMGCLQRSAPDTWTLTGATDPVASHANAPSPKDIASMPRAGKNQFQLMGVGVFNLPAHQDRLVLVKGLHLKAAPTSRINMTSITTVADKCEK